MELINYWIIARNNELISVLNTLKVSPTERKLNSKHKNNFYTSRSLVLKHHKI